MKFAGRNQYDKNRLNDYILGEIGPGTREQGMRENLN